MQYNTDTAGAVIGTHTVKITTGLPAPAEESEKGTEPETEVKLSIKEPKEYNKKSPTTVKEGDNEINIDLGKL